MARTKNAKVPTAKTDCNRLPILWHFRQGFIVAPLASHRDQRITSESTSLRRIPLPALSAQRQSWRNRCGWCDIRLPQVWWAKHPRLGVVSMVWLVVDGTSLGSGPTPSEPSGYHPAGPRREEPIHLLGHQTGRVRGISHCDFGGIRLSFQQLALSCGALRRYHGPPRDVSRQCLWVERR